MVNLADAFSQNGPVSIKSASDGIKKLLTKKGNMLMEKIATTNGNICAVADMAETLIEKTGVTLKEMHVDDNQYRSYLETILFTETPDAWMEGILFARDRQGRFYSISINISGTEKDGADIRSSAEIQFIRKNGFYREALVPDMNGEPYWIFCGEQSMKMEYTQVLSEEQAEQVRDRTPEGGVIMAICEGIPNAENLAPETIQRHIDDILAENRLLTDLAKTIGSQVADIAMIADGLIMFVVGAEKTTVKEEDGVLVINKGRVTTRTCSADEAKKIIFC